VSAIPAKALYHARKAASMPKPPPALVSFSADLRAPLLVAYSPQASMRKARSSVKKSMKNMTVDRSVHSNRMKVKTNQPVRKKPSAEFNESPELSNAAATPKLGVRMRAYEIQKPPYEDRAVAPKVLPTAISLSAEFM